METSPTLISMLNNNKKQQKRKRDTQMKNKVLVFDMDGTIADLYGVEDWLSKLRAENPSPYKDAAPIYNMEILKAILEMLKFYNYRIVVTSWLAKGSSEEYERKVTAAKIAWLAKYDFPYDEIHCISYGMTKTKPTKALGGTQILFDDSESVRADWSLGEAVNAKTTDIIRYCLNLLKKEQNRG